MAAQWSPEMEGSFITEVHKKRHLWDVRDPDFNKKTLKHLGYEEISSLLLSKWPNHPSLFNTELLKRKFLNLKSYYFKKKKLLSSFKSSTGSGVIEVQPKWSNFSKLSFLDDVDEPQEGLLNSCDIPVKCEMILSEESEEAPEMGFTFNETPRPSTSKRNLDCDKSSNREKRVKSDDDIYNNQASNSLQESSTEKRDLDGEDGYGVYLAEYMRSMSRKKREKARLKIQSILYSIKFNESSDEE